MIQDTNASFTNAWDIANSQTANKLDTSVWDAVKQGIISQADVDEFKATGSISDSAKNKIKDYQAWKTGTADPASWASSQSSSYQEWITEAIDKNKQSEAELNKIKEEELASSEKAKNEIIASEDKFAEDIKKIEDDNLKSQAELDAKEKARIAKEKEDAINNLKSQQEQDRIQADLEKQKLQAEAELLRQKNEKALIESEKNILVEQQKSAWAYNKLWLWFSSWIINQSQKIATDWIAKLAEIRAQMNYNERMTWIQQAEIWVKLNKIDLEYTSLINAAINDASEKEAELDRWLRDRLTQYNRNMTLTLKQKNDATQAAIRDWEKNKSTIERQHIQDIQAISNRWLELSKELQAENERIQNKEKEKIWEELLTWNLLLLSDDELAKREQAAWLPRGSIKQKTSSAIQAWIRSIVDNAIWKDFVIWDISKLSNEVMALVKQGRTLPEAIEQVGNKYAKDQPEYKAAQELKKKEAWYKSQMMDLDLEKSKLDIQGKKASIAASNAAAAASRASAADSERAAIAEAKLKQTADIIKIENHRLTWQWMDDWDAMTLARQWVGVSSWFLESAANQKKKELTVSDKRLLESVKDTKDKNALIKSFNRLSTAYWAEQAKNLMLDANENLKLDTEWNITFKWKVIWTSEIDLWLSYKDKWKWYNYEDIK